MATKQYRAVAEFEPQESIMVTWPYEAISWKEYSQLDVFVNVIRELAEVVHTYIQCRGCNKDEIWATLQENGINIDNVELVEFEPDTVIIKEGDLDTFHPAYTLCWPRDYGAEVVMADDGDRAVISFNKCMWGVGGATVYNREGAVTENMSRWHAKVCGIDNIIWTRLTSEGGDREYNGKGIMMTTAETEIDKRNPQYTREEIEKEWKRIAGIEKILWVPRGSYDEEDCCDGPVPGPDNQYNAYKAGGANCHMDEMARFADANTILCGYVDEEEAAKYEIARLNKERFDEAYEYLKNQTDLDGNPFRILRLPTPCVQYFTADFKGKDKDCLLAGYVDRTLDVLGLGEGDVTFVASQSYANFIITNGKVIAQQYWSEGLPECIKQKDEEALSVLREAFPDRKVVGVNTYALNILGGGIHCSSRQVCTSRTK